MEGDEPYTDYVYMDISNLIIYFILNKTILWLRCLHELLLEYSQQAPDVYVTSGWRCTWRRTDIAFWLKMKIGLTSIFDVDLTLDFGYTT